ncbi:cytochrome c [Marinobacter sp. SS8-8]|uniref:c-type cytochrome n=1 Tax=Marinobacter sp. SS8-8 TaxID=3050452 RepID=UPI000C3AE86A|nr:c-type cytochrome [Marinobacter sp. SS8-8]MAZ06069.1 cytochrome C [Halomonas sp.]|tara:strand:- start:126538 stop:126966 length:429 start_codon:yes stop_codon:yes gene_type:complete
MNRWFYPLVLLAVPVLASASGRPEDADSAPTEVIQGRQIYEQYCAACHGRQGEGAANWKKPDDKGEMPPPPHDETGHTWRHSDAMLYRMIAEGWRHPFNKSDRLTMPAFEKRMTAQEIQSVIDYLKTLWTDEQREYQKTESQ